MSNTVPEVLRAARLLFRAGSVVEVRVPKAGKLRTISGYFDDLEMLARDVAKLDFARYPGVYWTINPVDPALLSRGVNRTQGHIDSGFCSSDDSIVRRCWLPIDLDPKRPTGISSTEAQHEAALALGLHVQSELIRDGWTEAVFADSGNGAHLLYPIDLPNDHESRDLLSRVLQGLAARFDTRDPDVLVEVDQTMFNASRIIKIYGTTARKGDPTVERPHRLSRILQVPSLLAPVTVEQLQAQAVTAAPTAKPGARPIAQPYRAPRGGQEFSLEEFLGRYGIRYRTRLAYRSGWKYQLEECPWDPSHKYPDACVFDYADGFGFTCLHNSCHGRDWHAFRELFEGPKPQRRYAGAPLSAPPRDEDVPPPRSGLAVAPPPAEPPCASSDEGDKNLPLTLADVEAAAEMAIEHASTSEAMRLAPAVATLRPQHQAVVIAKLRDGFKDEWKAVEKWFEKALKGAIADLGAGDKGGGDAPPAGGPPPASGDASGGYPDLLGYPQTDSGNGERIVALFGPDIRYCLEFKKWLVWDGCRWAVDEASLMMRHKGKEMARILYLQALNRMPSAEKHARESESFKAITAALGSAAAEKGIAISVRELDQHPFLLNVPNGVLDLSTEKVRLLPHDRKFFITGLCPVRYEPDATCPRFDAFATWTMGGPPDGNPDAELSERTTNFLGFLQRLLGSTLTGSVADKAFFIFHGHKGNNGKTTLLTLMRRILGPDYACKILVETILISMKGADATARADLADLRGKRLVVTSEINKETKLDEALMKRITAGLDSIKTCRKYENPFEFDPTHKLVMDANYCPKIQGTDDAIWDRLRLLPFENRREKGARDKDLSEKLMAEARGVLAWLVRGCAMWRKQGLGEPPEIIEVGEQFRANSDSLREFIEECCELAEGNFVKATTIAAAYEWWCKQNRERYPIGRTSFIERLESKGLTRNHARRIDGVQARTWEGIQLRIDVAQHVERFSQRYDRAREGTGSNDLASE